MSEELLVGRNFYHYTDGERDTEQPFTLETDLSYLESADEEYDEDYDEDDEDESYDEELDEYLPRDCCLFFIYLPQIRCRWLGCRQHYFDY